MSERERSFWGWGWADKFPDEDARRAVAMQIGALLGFEGLEVLNPVRLQDVVLAPPRVDLPEALAGFSSAAHAERVMHTYGRSYRDVLRAFRGDFRNAPDWVARPRDESEVARVLAWASAERVAVVPYGGGTSVVGGVECDPGTRYRGVISLDMRALDRVLEVDTVSRAARIQAGATGPSLEAQLAPWGLTLRHFPQSFEFSTLGGWIATRAGGHFATLYTHIDDLVESVRLVTPAGVIQTRRLPASGAGPSPERLVLGSEGVLGVITEAWVRVQARPRWRRSASVHFDDFAAAVAATREISQSGLYPSNCRLLDAREAMMNAVTADGTNVLVLGFESADHAPDARIARAIEICQAYGGRCPAGVVRREEQTDSHDAAASWRQAFFEAPYLQNVMVSLGVIADTFETACTWDRFDALHAAVLAALHGAMERACGGGQVSCRFTHVYPDGPAPYYTFVAPGRPGEELEQWAEIKRAASDALIAQGATITHHHAVGRTHRPWYDRERPDLFAAALRSAKATLDPAGVMNPGALIDP